MQKKSHVKKHALIEMNESPRQTHSPSSTPTINNIQSTYLLRSHDPMDKYINCKGKLIT